jgi:hypothetical protein
VHGACYLLVYLSCCKQFSFRVFFACPPVIVKTDRYAIHLIFFSRIFFFWGGGKVAAEKYFAGSAQYPHYLTESFAHAKYWTKAAKGQGLVAGRPLTGSHMTVGIQGTGAQEEHTELT